MNEAAALREAAKPSSDLARLLKVLRGGLDPNVRDLGRHARRPSRIGKRVTQEELAEAIGVSREWYAALESPTTTRRTSPGLVGRLADALMMSPEDRARVFHLAVPELVRVQPRDDSIAVLEAFSRLRRLSKRLWAATAIEDVLTAANEQIADWFDSSVLVHRSHRRESGRWESQATDDKRERNDASAIIRELEDQVLPTLQDIDALNLYPRLINAGDIGTPELHPLPLRREIRKIVARQRLAGFTFLKARVRSRTGLIAGFCIMHEFGHAYSPTDRAVLGTFAELVSLVLS
jgi:transcriptional regulator with XRE-family HTH domain